jgi:hypothetical protein
MNKVLFGKTFGFWKNSVPKIAFYSRLSSRSVKRAHMSEFIFVLQEA